MEVNPLRMPQYVQAPINWIYQNEMTNRLRSNRLFNWGFERMEGIVMVASDIAQPAVRLLQTPIHVVDKIACKSIDFVEQKIPSIYLPPEMMYSNTKEYMSDHIVQPVLKRANSMKQLGTAVLDSRVSTYAAGRIDGAIDVADKYIEKYLPPEDQTDSAAIEDESDAEGSKPVHTLHKSQRFSRKLKRRLTQRTFNEARALKNQSKEAINILIYAAELMVYDPKQAITKAGELWNYLSQDEPDNQARPQTLEQLILLVTRESARKIVHLTNYSTASVAKIPRSIAHKSNELVHYGYETAGSLIKFPRLAKAKQLVITEANSMVSVIHYNYQSLQKLSTQIVGRLAIFLAGRPNQSDQQKNQMISSDDNGEVANASSTIRNDANPPDADNNVDDNDNDNDADDDDNGNNGNVVKKTVANLRHRRSRPSNKTKHINNHFSSVSNDASEQKNLNGIHTHNE